MTMHVHGWIWRRRRSRDYGFWECVGCGARSPRVSLDGTGRPLLSAEEALRDVAT